MTHAVLAVRVSLMLLVLAAAAALVVAALRSTPPSYLVIVRVEAIARPVPIYGQPFCYGYDWRRASIDLRPYCGY